MTPQSMASGEFEMLSRVLEVTRGLTQPQELAHVLGQVIEAGRRLIHADRASVFLHDPQNAELYTVAATGLTELRIGMDKGIAGQCARSRKLIHVPDCYRDDRFNPEIDRRTGYRTRCLLAIPLVGLDDELVGVLQALNSLKSGGFDEVDQRVAGVLAGQAAAAIQRARLLEERTVKIKMERDISLAREIQLALLPGLLPELPGYQLATYSQPADQTGGDIYDLIPRLEADGRMAGCVLLLADATGHGIGPALSVTSLRAMVRMGLACRLAMSELVAYLDRQLSQDLPSGRFITAFLGELDLSEHRLTYTSAGQGPILFYRAAQRKVVSLGANGLPLGIFDAPPPEAVMPLDFAPGDVLLLASDGFYECQNSQGKMLGQEAVGRLLIGQGHQSAARIVQALVQLAGEFSAGQSQGDDLTALVLKRQD